MTAQEDKTRRIYFEVSSHAKVMWYLGSSRFAFEVVLVIRHRSSVIGFSLMTNDY